MLTFFLVAVFLCVLGYVWRQWAKQAHRARLLASTLVADDLEVVFEMVPMLRQMPPDLLIRLQGKMTLFLDQVDIYGRGGVVVDRHAELSIAAQACLLIVNSDVWYETLRTILLYPGAFKSRQQSRDGFVVTDQDQARLGESWQHGPVVLSWPHAEQGGLNNVDGQNLEIHEFAHQLDALSGQTNAVPIQRDGQRFDDWEAAFMAGYDTHVANVARGRKTVLSDYAATNYVEFLAVSFEVFFEKPEKFQHEYPDVYQQISVLLGLDPLNWAD
jgi:Mlc titration factor MtfA (ptsG expression regulator)